MILSQLERTLCPQAYLHGPDPGTILADITLRLYRPFDISEYDSWSITLLQYSMMYRQYSAFLTISATDPSLYTYTLGIAQRLAMRRTLPVVTRCVKNSCAGIVRRAY